jgi:hypothetical protein
VNKITAEQKTEEEFHDGILFGNKKEFSESTYWNLFWCLKVGMKYLGM